MTEPKTPVRAQLANLVQRAAKDAQEMGLLPPGTLPEAVIERPQKPEHGDYASSLPLKLARSAGMNPIQIARHIVDRLPAEETFEVSTAPPGFINFRLTNAWIRAQVQAILDAGETYGDLDLGQGERVQVEFVSGNPTGPLHVGHARGAVLGSTLANILSAAGYAVQREYYVNDAGTQIDIFYRSLHARYQQALGREAVMPENGYQGQYLVDLAGELTAKAGDRFLSLPPEEALSQLGEMGKEMMLASIKEDLERLGVKFDSWFSERSLYERGKFQDVLDILRQKGYLEEREGALWFVSSALGEDKDNVVVRSTGLPTYFASDIAYHYDKFVERDFSKVINIWGADHLGHVSRMKAAAGALGIDPSRLQIIIGQMVTLRRGGEIVRASKRTGDIVTLRELLDEVGADPCRYFFLSHSADSQMDFDLELAKKQSQENPVYYVQYAHARIASILRNAQERSISHLEGDAARLTDDSELALIRKMILLPELVESAARNLEPHYLPHYALDLATAFHWFYQQCRVITQEEELTKARLQLVRACQIVLAKTLKLMGMSAPEQM